MTIAIVASILLVLFVAFGTLAPLDGAPEGCGACGDGSGAEVCGSCVLAREQGGGVLNETEQPRRR